jgi:hypothetical protein
MIESGQIDVEEGVRRLEALDGASAGGAEEGEPTAGAAAHVAETAESVASGAPGIPARPRYVQVLWLVVLNVGVAALAVGGVLVATAYGREGMPGLVWAWLVSAAGLLMMALGWWLKDGSWFTLRIRERSGLRFVISLPLPLVPAIWFLRVVAPFIPQLRRASSDGLLLAVRHALRQGRPFAVQVDEGDNGDRVEIHFG